MKGIKKENSKKKSRGGARHGAGRPSSEGEVFTVRIKNPLLIRAFHESYTTPTERGKYLEGWFS